MHRVAFLKVSDIMISLVKNNIFVLCVRPRQASSDPPLVAATGNPAAAVAIFEAIAFPSFVPAAVGKYWRFMLEPAEVTRNETGLPRNYKRPADTN